jgi:hypothetical protein
MWKHTEMNTALLLSKEKAFAALAMEVAKSP